MMKICPVGAETWRS